MRRTGWGIAGGKRYFLMTCFKRCAARDNIALWRCNRGMAAAQWTRVEIGIGLGGAHAGERAFDAHLTFQLQPGEQQCGVRIGADVASLAAVIIGVEHKVTVIHAFQQHRAR